MNRPLTKGDKVHLPRFDAVGEVIGWEGGLIDVRLESGIVVQVPPGEMTVLAP